MSVRLRLFRFPTLVLPRSGYEGRPIAQTLSRMAPLAMHEIVIATWHEVNGLLGLDELKLSGP
jgi:hypothetical protein